MRPEFLDDLSSFIQRLKSESEEFKGNKPFEGLMRGLSDGSVDFKWHFGGRLVQHVEPFKRPNLVWVRWLLSAPIIYPMVVPIAILDAAVSLYQAICFRLWEIPQVSRSKYFVIDRHRLSYLKTFQKLNCIYCGYANGVLSYARMIAGETEHYWCPVKHESDIPAPHNFYIEFSDYDDIEGWNSSHSSGVSNWGNGNDEFS